MSKILKSGKSEGNDKQTGRHQQETRWEEVATTAGITQAQIIAGRLQSEGIPARAWQESVGQTTGLVVGPLGMGHVLVPEEFVDRALEILDDVEEFDADGDQDDWMED
jgi:hypothetical protein